MPFSAYEAVPVVIANGATTSGTVPVQGRDVIGIQMPATFTGTALTFQANTDGTTTFLPVHDSPGGSAVSFTVAGGRYIRVARGTLGGMQSLRLVSGSAEAAARTIFVVLQPSV